jgi:hypothetical protein
MYVIRVKETDKVAVFREKKYLGEYINASVDTIRRKEKLNSWEWGNFIVYNPFKWDITTRRGGYREQKHQE